MKTHKAGQVTPKEKLWIITADYNYGGAVGMKWTTDVDAATAVEAIVAWRENESANGAVTDDVNSLAIALATPEEVDAFTTCDDESKYLKWVEQDGGLWQVWRRDTGDCVGYVWCDGYSCDERIGKPYVALDDWVDGVAPGFAYHSAKNLRGALAGLLRVSRIQTRVARGADLTGIVL